MVQLREIPRFGGVFLAQPYDPALLRLARAGNQLRRIRIYCGQQTLHVIPAQAGIHRECHMPHRMDSRLRGNDTRSLLQLGIA
jgi:hypothetical protein